MQPCTSRVDNQLRGEASPDGLLSIIGERDHISKPKVRVQATWSAVGNMHQTGTQQGEINKAQVALEVFVLYYNDGSEHHGYSDSSFPCPPIVGRVAAKFQLLYRKS